MFLCRILVGDNMYEEINFIEVGKRIRLERENFGMSREKLSELINISPYFLGQIERGERKMSIKTLVKVANCLHISIDSLLFEHDNINYGDQLHSMFSKCSKREADVIKDILNILLPHIAR